MTTPPKPWYRRVWVWIPVALVILVAIGLFLVDPIAAAVARQEFKQLKGFKANFAKIHVSLLSLTVTLDNFKVTDAGGGHGNPSIFYLEHVVAQVPWHNAVRLIPQGNADITGGKVTMLFDPKPPPKSDAEKEKKAVEQAGKAVTGKVESPVQIPDLYVMLENLLPVRLEVVKLHKFEAVAIDSHDPDRPRIWVHDIEATLENVGTPGHMKKSEPSHVKLKALLQHTGHLSATVTAETSAKQPTFSGEFELRGLQLSDFYGLIKDQAHLGVHGELDLTAVARAANGEVHGTVKPVIRRLRVDPTEPNVGNKLMAKAGQAAADTLSTPSPDHVAAAEIPIDGKISGPDVELWPTILSIVRNAFEGGFHAAYTPQPEVQGKGAPAQSKGTN